MMKFLKIKKKKKCDEYIVQGKGGVIGQIAKGCIFKKRIVLYPDYFVRAEWTSECLQQVVDKLKELEGM